METQDINIEDVYNEIRKKHNLPEFEKIAQDFDIEKIQNKETKFLLREVRRAISEKITAYIHLFENLINPNAPPIFIFSILQKMPQKDKNRIKEIYKTLSENQIEIMKLDTIYNEEKEAEFVKKIFKKWQELKKEIHELIENFEKNLKSEEISKNGSYFG